MSAPTVVTEGYTTITAGGAMSSEKEIRESVGFPESQDVHLPAGGDKPHKTARIPADDAGQHDAPTQDTDASDSTEVARGPDGKFKSKESNDAELDAPKVKEDKYGGDPRKDKDAKIERERQLRGAAERENARLSAELAAARSQPAPVPAVPVRAEVPAAAPSPVAPASHFQLVQKYQGEPDFPQLDQAIAEGMNLQDAYQATGVAQALYINQRELQEIRQQQAEQHQVQQAQQRVSTVFQSGSEKYADWQDLFKSPAAEVDLSDAVLNEIYRPDSPSEDLLHHILTSPDDMDSLAQISHLPEAHRPIAAARLVARLTAGLVAAHSAPAQAQTTQTQAKPLIKAVSGSLKAPEAESPDDLPFSKRYIDEMNAKERKQSAHR